jgi:hypothetical protein
VSFYVLRPPGVYHLPLLLAVDQVIVVLHGNKFVPAILLRNVLQRLKLPASHRAGTDISHPSLLNNIVQRLHDLLPGCVAVETVDLQNIDVCAQSLNALLHRVEDVLAAQTDLVDHVAVVGGDRCNAEAGVFFVDAEVAL